MGFGSDGNRLTIVKFFHNQLINSNRLKLVDYYYRITLRSSAAELPECREFGPQASQQKLEMPNSLSQGVRLPNSLIFYQKKIEKLN